MQLWTTGRTNNSSEASSTYEWLRAKEWIFAEKENQLCTQAILTAVVYTLYVLLSSFGSYYDHCLVDRHYFVDGDLYVP